MFSYWLFRRRHDEDAVLRAIAAYGAGDVVALPLAPVEETQEGLVVGMINRGVFGLGHLAGEQGQLVLVGLSQGFKGCGEKLFQGSLALCGRVGRIEIQLGAGAAGHGERGRETKY